MESAGALTVSVERALTVRAPVLGSKLAWVTTSSSVTFAWKKAGTIAPVVSRAAASLTQICAGMAAGLLCPQYLVRSDCMKTSRALAGAEKAPAALTLQADS